MQHFQITCYRISLGTQTPNFIAIHITQTSFKVIQIKKQSEEKQDTKHMHSINCYELIRSGGYLYKKMIKNGKKKRCFLFQYCHIIYEEFFPPRDTNHEITILHTIIAYNLIFIISLILPSSW